MSDEIDKAVELHDEITNREIQNIRNQANKPAPKGIGVCLFCRSKVHGDDRWCDSDCRDDYEHENRMKRL